MLYSCLSNKDFSNEASKAGSISQAIIYNAEALPTAPRPLYGKHAMFLYIAKWTGLLALFLSYLFIFCDHKIHIRLKLWIQGIAFLSPSNEELWTSSKRHRIFRSFCDCVSFFLCVQITMFVRVYVFYGIV